MPRNFNLLTTRQTDFVSDSTVDYGGWSISGTRFSRRSVTGSGPYRRYTPTSDFGTSLQIVPDPSGSGTETSMVVTSPEFQVIRRNTYNVSLAYASLRSTRFRIKTVFIDASNANITNPTEYTIAVTNANSWGVSSSYFVAPDNAIAAKIQVTFDRSSFSPATIGADDVFAIYDPVVFDATERSGRITTLLYNDLPEYLRTKDLEVSFLEGQISYPLSRYVEALATRTEDVYATVKEWGAEKSSLGDPEQANLLTLRWLASLLGVASRSGYTSGSTTWSDLEGLDKDADGNPGEWEDWEALGSWRELESSSVQSVSEETLLRQLVRTGGTGIHAGRTKNVEDLIVYSLEQEGASAEDVHVRRGPRKKLDSVQVYVTQGVDPGENRVSGVVDLSTGAGTEHEVVNSIMETASSCWTFSNPNDEQIRNINSSPTDKTVPQAKGVVNDDGGMGRHIVFATEANAASSAGGLIGTSTYTDGAAFYLGHGSRILPASSASAYSVNGDDLEIIACLSDVEPITASAYTGNDARSTNEPEDWFFRDKRLIAFGIDGENWALYLASGLTPNRDNDTRILWVEDYITPRKANMAWSEPLNLGHLNNEGVWYLRMTRVATLEDSAYPVKFYAQASLYDNWESNPVGSDSIGALDSASSTCRIVLGGEPLNSNGSAVLSSGWAGKNSPKALKGTLHCIMMSTDSDVFNARSVEQDLETDNTIAIINGFRTNARDSVEYKPDISLDFSELDPYEIPENYQYEGSSDVLAVSATSYTVDTGQSFPVIVVPDNVEIGVTSAGVSANSVTIRYVDNTGTERTRTTNLSTNINMPSDADLWTSSTNGPYFIRDMKVYSGSTLRATLEPSDLEGGGFSFNSSNYARLLVSGIYFTFRTSSSADPIRTPLATEPILDVHIGDRNYLRPLSDAYILNPDPLLDSDEWSFMFQVRWNGTATDVADPIFKAYMKEGTSEKRILDLRVRGEEINATYARSFQPGGGAIATETVSYSTDVSNSVNRDLDWHTVVIRRKPSDGLSLWVDGVKRETERNTAVVDPTVAQNFTGAQYWRIQSGNSAYGSRVMIGPSAYFDRWLSDEHIVALST